MLLMLFFLNTNIFAAKVESVVDEKIKPLRIGFFIGSSKESFGAGEGGAITYDLACAISQKALDIAIVSDYILKNLVLRKYTKVVDPALEKDRKDFDRILEKIDFNLSDWDFYYLQDTQFFVLVPHDYDNPIFNKAKWAKIDIPSNPEYNGSGEVGFPKIPWIGDTPSEAKRLLSNENLRHIPYAKNLDSKIETPKVDLVINRNFDPVQLAWIFKPVDDYENLNLLQPCNIYVSGHGTYSESLGTVASSVAGMPPEDMASMLLFFNDKMNTKSVRISTCEAGGKNLDLIQVKKDLTKLVDITSTIPIRIRYTLIIDSITDAPTTSDWRPEDAANIGLKEYFNALEKFQTGYKDFVDKLSIIKAKISALNLKIKEKLEKIESSGNKIDLGLEIEKLEAEIEGLKAERKSIDKNNGLLDVLDKISLPKHWYLRPLGVNSYPQVWFPEIGWFQTFRASRITDAMIIKWRTKPIREEVEFETKTGTIEKTTRLKYLDFDQNIAIKIIKQFALLLYSEIVFANIEFTPIKMTIHMDKIPKWIVNLYRQFPSIQCVDGVCKNITTNKATFYVYPQIISMQHGSSLNLFSKVTLPIAGDVPPQNGILNFLRDSFFILRGRSISKTFFIKELQGFNDFSELLSEKNEFKKFLDSKGQKNKEITLQNVLINTCSIGLLKKDKTDITLSFEFMGKSWYLSYPPTNLNPDKQVPPTNKEQFLWKFKESNNGKHEANLKRYELTSLAMLTSANYYNQLSTIRRLFKNQTKSLQKFIQSLKSEEITEAMQETPNITKGEWQKFEQSTNLKLKLKGLKISLIRLKQKLFMLQSKLKQLAEQLSSTT